jgi:hypothetical protein
MGDCDYEQDLPRDLKIDAIGKACDSTTLDARYHDRKARGIGSRLADRTFHCLPKGIAQPKLLLIVM